MSLRALVLAAGKGTRMKSEIPKVLHKVNGVPMVKRILNVLEQMNTQKNILILGYKKDMILEYLVNVDYVFQEQQLGTAHAVMQTKEKMTNYDGDVIIINGDLPLITYEDLNNFYNFYKNSKSDLALLTALFENPTNYGRIKEENSKIVKIIEEKDASAEEKKIKKINVGAYIVKSKFLFEALDKVTDKNNNSEYYLTDIVEIFLKDNRKVDTYLIENVENVKGVNSKYELSLVEKIARDRKNKKLMENGVTLIDSNSTYIEDSVEISIDTIIYPNVFIQGNTKIGTCCEILSNTRIIDSTIANNVRIEASVIEESILDDFVTMGPFAHLRPKSHLKKSVHIGNFVEVKKSILEEGVKSGHLTYLGDSHIGAKTNIGAGTITCNYDGKNKYKTEVGENVFIGSDSIIVAPVNIGNNSFIGAGSVITKNVPDNSLAVERNQQKIIENWRKK